MTTKRWVIVILLIIIFIGCVLRISVFEKYRSNHKLEGDAFNYQQMSIQLVDDGIYGYGFGNKSSEPNAFVPPVYPLFLSSIYWVFHSPTRQITIARLIQVLVGGALTPLLAFLFVYSITKRKYTALLTALFTAIYPTYIQSSIFILTEVFALSSMLLYFYLIIKAIEKKKFIFNFLAGVAFALQVLIRPTMLPLFIIPFIFLLLTTFKSNKKTVLKMFTWNLVGFIILMCPWWIRNFIVLNHFVITSTGAGNPLLAGTYPYKQGIFNDISINIMKSSEKQAEYAKKRIFNGFTTQPLLYLKWYTVGKIQQMFKMPWLYYLDTNYQFYHRVIHGAFIWLGLIGVLRDSLLNKLNRFLYVYALIFLGLYLIFIPEVRYAYQLMFFVMFAAASLICSSASIVREILIRAYNKKENLLMRLKYKH